MVHVLDTEAFADEFFIFLNHTRTFTNERWKRKASPPSPAAPGEGGGIYFLCN